MAAGDVRIHIVASNGEYRPPAGRTEMIIGLLLQSGGAEYAIENGGVDLLLGTGVVRGFHNVKLAIDNTNYFKSTFTNSAAHLTTVEV